MKAFPTDRLGVIKDTRGISINETQQDGMDLRDYFAAAAMQGMLAHTGVVYGKTASLDDSAGAIRAYEIADKMLKAREAK